MSGCGRGWIYDIIYFFVDFFDLDFFDLDLVFVDLVDFFDL